VICSLARRSDDGESMGNQKGLCVYTQTLYYFFCEKAIDFPHRLMLYGMMAFHYVYVFIVVKFYIGGNI
jgi:hypothetical protein